MGGGKIRLLCVNLLYSYFPCMLLYVSSLVGKIRGLYFEDLQKAKNLKNGWFEILFAMNVQTASGRVTFK